MQPILRFLQLLCENHNRDLQVGDATSATRSNQLFVNGTQQPIIAVEQKFITNVSFQNYLRNQNNKTNYNLVCETLQFLDCICGSTTGGLGLLGLYINESNVALINQTLESLTEYCQGPCHDNQVSVFPWSIAAYLLIILKIWT